MKKAILLLLLISGFINAYTQQVFTHYQDGKIWFKLKNEYRTNDGLQMNPKRIPLEHIPFLQGIAEQHQITNLSKPFSEATGDEKLQRTYLLEFSDVQHVNQIIKKISAIEGVEYAEKVPLFQHFLTPNDPSYGSQWALTNIGAATAWNYFSAGSTIVIAIVDDAVQRTHNDLAPVLWVNPGEISGNNIDDDNNGYIDDINGYDVASGDNNPNPPSSAYDHGTHVAGISCAASNNGIGVASIGFSCKLMSVKSTTTASAVTHGYEGIVYAAKSGADVINCSWGGPTNSTTGQNVINYAWGLGAIIVAASGNDNVSSQFYPAAHTNVISVASTSSNNAKSSFSNYGSWIDISAPGSNIYSTTVGNTYGNKSGTSMASPMVAGLLGLMWSLNPTMPRSEIINCLLSTATNINAQNPNYIGQLGAGRINAAAAMQCVNATLSNAPVADFAANFTTITAGGQITFSDLSVYNPTSWSWSFPGGTPGSYNGQNPPPITYANPGLYAVTLSVTNANGNDVEQKLNYINVTTAGGCYSINLPLPTGWGITTYYTGATVGSDGWINGMNIYLDKQKAMYFDASAQPYNYITQTYIGFGRGYSANQNKVVPVRVYDGTSGTVGALLGTTNLTMGTIMSDVDNSYYTVAQFANPVTLPASKKFFVSVDLSNLQWNASVKDTLAILSNQAGQSTGFPIWEQQSDNLWYQYGSAGSWNLNASLLIHPFLTNEPANATFTQTSTSICQGQSITFDAAGSTFQDTLVWVFPGGSPNIVSDDPNPTVYFNTPGNHQVILYVIGGGCSELDTAFVDITVLPTPVISVVATQTEICTGGSSVLTASGATSYIWTPSNTLSSSTGASVTATPTGPTTYQITGSNGSCEGNTTIEIDVLENPVASVTVSDNSILCNESVVYDASASLNATDFLWTFNGGSPATSNASGASVAYNATGSFTATLTVSNICGQDNSYTTTINVTGNCSASLEDENSWTPSVIYQPLQEGISISWNTWPPQNTLLSLTNALGQVIYSSQLSDINHSTVFIPMQHVTSGLYIVRLSHNQQQHTIKLIKP